MGPTLALSGTGWRPRAQRTTVSTATRGSGFKVDMPASRQVRRGDADGNLPRGLTSSVGAGRRALEDSWGPPGGEAADEHRCPQQATPVPRGVWEIRRHCVCGWKQSTKMCHMRRTGTKSRT